MAEQEIKETEDLVEIVNNEQETEDLVEVVNEFEEGHQPSVSTGVTGVIVVTSRKLTEEEKRKAKERKERLFREVEEFDAQTTYHFDEMKRLDRELERIQDQLQTATNRITKKQLEHELSITQVKRDIAGANRELTNALTWQKYWERDFNKDRAEKCSTLANLWQKKVEQYEDHLMKLESKQYS